MSYGYTDLTLAFAVMKQKQDYSKVPAFHNADANFRIKTSNTGMMKYYGYLSRTNLPYTSTALIHWVILTGLRLAILIIITI